jgi:hypothetical protein
MPEIDPDKLEAALEQLEGEKERRLQARVDSGEVVRQTVEVVVGARDEDTEAATARALANLPTSTSDGRAIHYDLQVIVTGVPRRDPDYGNNEETSSPQVQTISEERNLSNLSEETAGSGGAILSPPSQPTPVYVRVVVSNGGEDDPGAIVEAHYIVEDGCVVLTDLAGKHMASRMLLKNDDPAVLARSLLREREASTDFNQPIRYPGLGLA